MNRLITGLLAAIVLATIGANSAFAGNAKHAMSSVKLPYSFVCRHCGIKMTIKTAADWKKDCWVCACGTQAVDCQSKQK